MQNKWKFLVLAVLVISIGLGVQYMTSNADGIEEGKVYGLGMTYKATSKDIAEGRIFDFTDRNLPRTSILVPARDARGIPLVREVDNIPPSTVRKVRIRVPEKKVEDVIYPAYEYVEWQFRFATREPQTHVPTVVPRR